MSLLYKQKENPQFDKDKSNHVWFTLTYQSNDALNDAAHASIKILIAEKLYNKFNIVDMHSYIHGNVIFSINPNFTETIFDSIVTELNKSLVTYTPKLLFNLSIVGIDGLNPWVNFMYINGSDTLNKNFHKSLESIIK